MTEAEWETCTDPTPMLAFLGRKATDRKLRLFAAACCLRGRSILRSKKTRAVLEALEAYADGLITRNVMEERRSAWFSRFDYPFPLSGTWNSALAHATMTHTKVWAGEAADHAARACKKPEKEKGLQASVLRDIFGDPFRHAVADPSWLTSTVVSLSTGIYSDRAFDRLPILADALQDAGCDSDDILNHCRSEGAHVRGCWVVDLLTGRE